MQITLPTDSVLEPRPLRQPYKRRGMRCQETEAYGHFVDTIQQRAGRELEGVKYTHVYDTVAEGQVYHDNYLGYLTHCWDSHRVAVVTPDILWYMLLCEVSSVVRANPEVYRALFTRSEQHETLTIKSDSLTVMPMGDLIKALSAKMPLAPDAFLPTFSTSTVQSQHAFYAALCDAVSPYYSYEMCCCGIPAYEVRGTRADWRKLADAWDELIFHCFYKPGELEGVGKWAERASATLHAIHHRFTDTRWWQRMFGLEKCGSGSDLLLTGWIRELYLERDPELAKPQNFSSHISKVSYKQLNTGKLYEMFVGLLFSRDKSPILEPDFGFVVLEKTEA